MGICFFPVGQYGILPYPTYFALLDAVILLSLNWWKLIPFYGET